PIAAALMQDDERTPFVVALLATVLIVVAWSSKSTFAPEAMRTMSAVNRAAAVVGVWVMAAAIRHVIAIRNQVAEQLWLQKARSSVAQALLGEQSPEEIGRHATGALVGLVGADVGVLYRLDGTTLVRSGGHAIDESTVPLRLSVGEGLAGQVAADGIARVLEEVPEGHLPVRSALGAST